LPLGQGQKYTIGKIEVSGLVSYNEQTVIAFAGLKPGEEIFFPGERVTKVLKKLWDSNLFSDINLYITNVEGNVADIEIAVTEVPELAEVRIDGIKKKSTREELIKENNLTPGVKVTENLVTTTKNYIESKYRKDGFFNLLVMVIIAFVVETSGVNKFYMLLNVDLGD